MNRWGSAVLGAAVLLAMEGALVYGAGLKTVVSKQEAVQSSHALTIELDHRWPAIQASMMANVRPIVRQEVAHVVNQTTINIGGIPVRLPADMRGLVADKLNQVLEKNLSQYMRNRFKPSLFLTPHLVAQVLAQPVTVHLWVEVWRIPIPVTVEVR